MEISASELKEKLGVVFLLDVRTPAEYADWKIAGSVNMPIDSIQSRIKELPKDREIIAICAHGMRSKYVTSVLSSMGYNVKSVSGGMSAWNSVYDPVLAASLAKGKIIRVSRLGKGCLGYIIASEGKAALIDVSLHIDEFIKIASRLNLAIIGVIDTHQHADHLSGSRMLAEKTGAKIYLNPLDGYKFSNFEPLKEGSVINVGSLEIKAMHTPGHTKGSTSFLVDNYILTGDTLFTDGIARPDLHNNAAEYANDLYDTYHNKLLTLSEKTIVLPSHCNNPMAGPIFASLAEIKKRFPVLELSRSEFAQAVSKVPPEPPNFMEILKINKGEEDFYEGAEELEECPNRCILNV